MTTDPLNPPGALPLSDPAGYRGAGPTPEWGDVLVVRGMLAFVSGYLEAGGINGIGPEECAKLAIHCRTVLSETLPGKVRSESKGDE